MKRTLPTILLLLASSALAQTYVVAAGGGGQFTDLPAAVAAVPSGATLHVKPGSGSRAGRLGSAGRERTEATASP